MFAGVSEEGEEGAAEKEKKRKNKSLMAKKADF